MTRVLVVDDEPQILRALGINLRARGYDVDLALKPDGRVVSWGYNYYGESTVPLEAQSGVIAVAAGLRRAAISP